MVTSNSSRYHWILKLLFATWKSQVWQQNRAWLFYYFNFERNYYVLKSTNPCILLNKNTNFNKNGTESKLNSTHSSRETNYVLQLIWESQIKNDKLGLAKEKGGIFCTVYFVKKEFFKDLCVILIRRGYSISKRLVKLLG